jgi:hypothetical protein
MLTCSKCKRDSGLDGQVSGCWTCGTCVDRKRVEDKIARLRRTLEAREELRRGDRRAILVPGLILPPETTDDEAQRAADEQYGIRWERCDDRVIIWCEM